MRKPRLVLEKGGAVYHCVVWVAGGQRLFAELEKDKLQAMMREHAGFCGIEPITHCVMSDHFHLLLRTPEKERIPDDELLRRVRRHYSKDTPYRQNFEQACREHGGLTPELRKSLQRRMGDLSVFMKELKQCFSKWFNRQHHQSGTLWVDRYKSVIVEDAPSIISIMAAYIDLNPVRCGLVSDPKDYPWCGYADAAAGNREARRGLASCHQGRAWRAVEAAYRESLMGKSDGRKGRKAAPDREAIRKAVEAGEEVPLSELLRMRIRYFTDGGAIGSEEFVDSVFAEFRDSFGPKRRTGARPLRNLKSLQDTRSLRDLQVKPYG